VSTLERGRRAATYHIGGGNPRANLDVLRLVLRILDRPTSLLTHVTDRLGHDRRYAVDCSRASAELGWNPEIEFEEGLRETVKWYQDNEAWLSRVRSGEYQAYYERLYGSDSRRVAQL
jgi:dTDP-glucose 4,6-dehydratase